MMNKLRGILVVDDSPENLRVLGSILEEDGYVVRVTTDGPQALQSAKASPPDLILLDIMMPEMDGFEVCRHLKADPDLCNIPVIFISALDKTDQKVLAFREGGVDYITKPFHVEEVLARVHVHHQLSKFEALSISEARMSNAFNYAAIGMAFVAPDGRWIKVNPAVINLLGFTEEELLAKTFQDITHPDDLQTDLDYVRRLLAGEISTYQMEKRYFRKDGQIVWVLLSVSLVRDQAGQPLHFISQIQDITERNRAEDLMRMHSELLKNMSEGVYLVRANDGTILYTNPKFEKMFGYESGEMIGQSVSIVNAPAEKRPEETAREIVEAITKTGEWNGEIKNIKKDGTTFWCYAGCSLFNHAEYGKTILAVHTDITERKKVEDALRENEALLRIAGRTARFGGWGVNLSERRVVWSDEVANIHEMEPGYSPSIEAGTDFYAPEWQERISKVFQDCVLNGAPYDEEIEIITARGHRVWVRTTGEAIRDESGAIVRVQGAFQDISDRRRAEEALKETSRYVRSLFESSLDPMITISSSGKITDVNTATERITGESRENLIGSNFSDYFTDPDKARAGYQTAFAQGQVKDYPLAVRHVSGTVTDVLYNATVYRNEHGEVIGVFAAAHDITDRKRVEEARARLEAQNHQVQKADSLARMAGAIAHHFNNQLHAAMGNLEITLEELPSDMEVVENVNEALAATRRAAELSGLMLTYLGQTTGKREPLDLADACRRNLPMLQAAMPKSATVKVDLPSPGPAIIANASQVQQLLTNLVTNAWEASGKKPCTIDLSIKTAVASDVSEKHRFPIDWQPQDVTYACLQVADTGEGIAATDIENLFDPFYSKKFAGRGLGLPVALGIVRAHEGVITVESEPGKGSVFRIYFPLTTEEHKRPSHETTQAEVRWSGNVILADDDEMVRKIAAAMLVRLGFGVISAKDGVEALELFREHPENVRCILCDLTMPRMDGWETLTALNQIAPEIPVILASGYDEAYVRKEPHSALPKAYLGKPYKFQELKEVIQRVLAAQEACETVRQPNPSQTQIDGRP